MSRDGGRGPHSHLGDLHHGQAVRKTVFGKVFRLPERRSLSVTCLAKSRCPKALNTRIANLKKIMGTKVQAQLYTVSFRKAIYRPQKLLKIADWG